MCQIIIQNGAQKIQLQAELGALLSDLLRQAIPAFAARAGNRRGCASGMLVQGRGRYDRAFERIWRF